MFQNEMQSALYYKNKHKSNCVRFNKFKRHFVRIRAVIHNTKSRENQLNGFNGLYILKKKLARFVKPTFVFKIYYIIRVCTENVTACGCLFPRRISPFYVTSNPETENCKFFMCVIIFRANAALNS